MSKGRYSIDMTTGSLMPKIIKFTIPILLTGLLQIFYNAADIVVVGRFAGSSTYLAAVGATSTLVNLMFNLFFGISVGAGIVVAKYIGAGDGKAIHRSVHTSMLFSLLSGVILGVCSYFLSPFLLTLMKTPDDILPLSAVYLKIFFIGAPATVIYNFGASILRSTGDSKRPLYILALTGIINILLNLLFVIQFKMNVRGVAVATVIAQYISAVIVLFILLNTDGFIRLIPSKLRFYKTELLEILKIGLPAGLQGSLFSFSNTIIQSSVNTFGAATIAGNTAAINIDSIIYTSTNAVAQTTITFTSQNLGANNLKRIRKIYFYCMLLAFLFSSVLCMVFYIFRTPLLGIFTTDPEVIKMGSIRVGLFAFTYYLNSLIDVTSNQMRGLGKSVVPMVISLAGICGIRMIWIFTYFKTHRTYEVLLFSYPISWAFTLAALTVLYIITYRKLVKERRHE